MTLGMVVEKSEEERESLCVCLSVYMHVCVPVCMLLCV